MMRPTDDQFYRELEAMGRSTVKLGCAAALVYLAFILALLTAGSLIIKAVFF